MRSIIILPLMTVLITIPSYGMEGDGCKNGSLRTAFMSEANTPSPNFKMPPLKNILAAVKEYDSAYALDRRQSSDLGDIHLRKGNSRETFFSALMAGVRNGLFHQRQLEAIQFYVSSLEQPKPPKRWVPSPQDIIDACNEVNKESKLWPKQEEAVRQAYERFLRHQNVNDFDLDLKSFDNGNGKAKFHRNHLLAILNYVKNSSLVEQPHKNTTVAPAPRQQLPQKKPSEPSPGSPWKVILKREVPCQVKPNPIAVPSLALIEPSDSEEDSISSSNVLTRYLELPFPEVQDHLSAYFAKGYPDLGKSSALSEETRSHDTSEEETEELIGEHEKKLYQDLEESNSHWVDSLLSDRTEGPEFQRIETPPESEVEETS